MSEILMQSVYYNDDGIQLNRVIKNDIDRYTATNGLLADYESADTRSLETLLSEHQPTRLEEKTEVQAQVKQAIMEYGHDMHYEMILSEEDYPLTIPELNEKYISFRDSKSKQKPKKRKYNNPKDLIADQFEKSSESNSKNESENEADLSL